MIDAKFAKAGLEAGLEGVKAMQEQTITAQQRIIAKSEALVAEYGKYSQTSKEEALKAANEAESKAEGLNKIATAAGNVFTSATAKMALAKNLVDESVYLANATATKVETVAAFVTEYTYSDGTYGFINSPAYDKLMADTEQMSDDVTLATRVLDVNKLNLKEKNKALADKKLTETYKDAAKAVTDAKKVYDEATTTLDKSVAKQALEAAEAALKIVTQLEENAVETATADVEKFTAELKIATDKLAAVNSNEAAYIALLKAWEDARKARLEAYIAGNKATHDYTVQNTLATSLRGIATATSDIATLILTEKEAIATAKATIAETKLVASKEEMIALEDRKIAKLEQQLKIDEAAYASYMAQIKALIEAAK